MSFSFKISHNGTVGALIKFKGFIDEMANFDSIKIPAESNKLTIDLKDIQLLNSVGLRSWVLWIKTLKQNVIALKSCPSVAVHQMSILEGFMPLKSIVESFEVPYHCESCGLDTLNWVERGVHYFERTADQPEWLKIPETVECQSCGKASTLDVIPAKYFRFLKGHY